MSINYQGQEPFDIRKLLAETQSKQDAITTKEGDLICIEVPSEQTMYYFTQSNHPLHPSVVIRTVVTGEERIKINTKGYTSGDQKLFEQWLKQFARQDAKIKKNLTEYP